MYAQVHVPAFGRPLAFLLPDIFANARVTDRQAFLHQLAMDVGVLETLFPHAVATSAVVLLQAAVNLFRHRVSHHAGRIFSRRVLGPRGQELVNPGVGIGLDGGLVGIDETGDCLPVGAGPAGNRPQAQFIYAIEMKNLLLKVHGNHCLEIYLRKSTMLPVVPFSNRMVGDFCFTIYTIAAPPV